MSKRKYICMIRDNEEEEFSIGSKITTNLKSLKEFQKSLLTEDVDCKIFSIQEIKIK